MYAWEDMITVENSCGGQLLISGHGYREVCCLSRFWEEIEVNQLILVARLKQVMDSSKG